MSTLCYDTSQSRVANYRDTSMYIHHHKNAAKCFPDRHAAVYAILSYVPFITATPIFNQIPSSSPLPLLSASPQD
jgi:hypothetical protein